MKFFIKQNPDKSDDMEESSELLSFEERMKHFENYFRKHVETNPSFIPEYEASKKINVITFKERITVADIRDIVQIFNTTNQKPHYNGSGWLDFRGHILSLIVRHGLEYNLTENEDIELI